MPRLGPPTATLNAPSVASLRFNVAWQGDDGAGSGVVGYDVQVSPDGSNWTSWLTATTQTQAPYLGRVGQQYYFRAQAIDLVGNTGNWSATAGPVTIEAVTKYYTFGGQKVAMRRGAEAYSAGLLRPG